MPVPAGVMYVILRVAGSAGAAGAGAAGAAGKAVFRIFKRGTKAYKEALKRSGTEEVARSPVRAELVKRLPGRSPGAGGGRSPRGGSPGARGGRIDRIRPEEGTLPPRNRGGIVRSTTKLGSKKSTTRKGKK
ncbi:hypothetical protein CL634_06580 [bacterium]|nr:hypothetical protein [bacterium]